VYIHTQIEGYIIQTCFASGKKERERGREGERREIGQMGGGADAPACNGSCRKLTCGAVHTLVNSVRARLGGNSHGVLGFFQVAQEI
jgi:hypothetical protein